MYRADCDSLLEGGSFELAHEASAPAPWVDGPRILEGEIRASRATPTHVWVLLNDRRMLRMMFGACELETIGVMHELRGDAYGFEIVADSEGEVLVFAGAHEWVAYDVASRRFLWHRELDNAPQRLAQDAHFGELNAGTLTLVHPRTGRATGELQRAVPFYQRAEGWRDNGRFSDDYLLIDSAGRARCRMDKRQVRYIAADGTAGVALNEHGLLVVAFRHEANDD